MYVSLCFFTLSLSLSLIPERCCVPSLRCSLGTAVSACGHEGIFLVFQLNFQLFLKSSPLALCLLFSCSWPLKC
uniref:Putative secreted protein n=1 Tax=Anopheles darlingi TaxID=43151 RepID=A0A2M4DAN4_ANODA